MAKEGIVKPETSEVENGLVHDACMIIEQAQKSAYRAVNETLIMRNWLLGMRIQHEVLKEQRAEYGEQIIKSLAQELTQRYGRGFKKSNLYLFVSFYSAHQDIFQSVTGKSVLAMAENILHTVRGRSEIVPAVSGFSEGVDLNDSLKPTQAEGVFQVAK